MKKRFFGSPLVAPILSLMKHRYYHSEQSLRGQQLKNQTLHARQIENMTKSLNISRAHKNDELDEIGVVWDSESSPTVNDAWESGMIRTVDCEREDLKVVFTNNCDQELILCWISSNCTSQRVPELHHFYRIPPFGGKHQESTFTGDAFALFAKAHDGACDEEESKVGRILAAYRPLRLTTTSEGVHNQQFRHHIDISQKHPGHSFKSVPSKILNPFACCTPRMRSKVRVGDKILVCKVEVSHEVIAPTTPYDSTKKEYVTQKCGPWTLRCEPGWDDYSADCKRVFYDDLMEATKRLPRHAQNKLCVSTIFWLNKSQLYGPCKEDPIEGKGACFHPAADWLIENGERAEKAGGVEFYSMKDYFEDRHLWGEWMRAFSPSIYQINLS